MYSFLSPPHPKSLHVLTVFCFVGAIILLSVSGVEGLPYPLIYQAAAFGLATAGIYFLTRYVLRQYRYEIAEGGITDAAGQPIPDLIITQTAGKKITVAARVGLRDIGTVTVIAEKSSDAKEKKTEICRDKRVFTYLNTPFYTSACYISLNEENSVLVIPVDDRMIHILQRSAT